MSEWTPKVRRVSSGEDKAKLAFLTSLLSEGRFEEAAAEASKVLETEERSFSANMAMGRALQGQKKYEDSLVYFKRAAEIDPMQATAHLMVGMSAEDRLLGLMMIANGLAFLIGAAVYWLTFRIEQAELNTREKLLQLELRLAELGEKQ